MPQQPVGAGSPSYTGNTSGTGAVFFDSAPDLLSVHMQNLNKFEEAAKQREAQKAKAAAGALEMFNGMKLDTPGILDTDLEMFSARAKGINDYIGASLKAGIDPTKAGAGAYANQMQRLVDQYNLDAKVSENQRKAAEEALKSAQTNPDEYDIEATQKKIQEFGAIPFDKRNKNLSWADLAVRKPDNLLELTKTKVLKDIPLDATSVTVKDPLTGGYKVETTETYTPQRIAGMAQAGYLGNDDITKSVNRQYEAIVDPIKQASLVQQAQAESKALGRTVSPQELFYREYLEGLNPKKVKSSGLVFTPMQREAAKNYYRELPEEQFVKYLAEAIKKAGTDDETFWGEAVDISKFLPMQTVAGVTGAKPPSKVQFSNALNGLPIGKATVTQNKKDAQGNIYTDYQTIDNRVLNMKRENGKVYIQTDESLINFNNQQEGATGWEELNDRTIDKLVLGSKDPIKAAKALRQTLLQMNAYPQQNVQLNKPTQQPKPTGKQLVKTLSSGRKVYSDDNGKTWHP